MYTPGPQSCQSHPGHSAKDGPDEHLQMGDMNVKADAGHCSLTKRLERETLRSRERLRFDLKAYPPEVQA